MTKSEIFQRIRNHRNDIEKYGVVQIGLFGSYVRNEQKETSDIDILVDLEPGKRTFDNFMGLCFYLDDLFSEKKVEVVTTGGLSKYIGPHILKEVEYA